MNSLDSNSIASAGAKQISRSGTFDLQCTTETAFPLFSPEGERYWVKGWDPRPVFPETIAFEPETVFLEGSGDGEAVWTIIDVNQTSHRAEYVRLAPQSHAAHIVVQVEPLANSRSHVTVSYVVTAFGLNAAEMLAAFSESAYAEKMCNWQRQISSYLEKQNPR